MTLVIARTVVIAIITGVTTEMPMVTTIVTRTIMKVAITIITIK